ncbi:hypothetical protein J437_LFUL005278 [Ladona fulva]|uniref:FAD-binding domain-containing protein n=1 Tax=Ladona fulva TaxID=123851 RepID=A0A8K0NYP8_LADFU|nr:hypothetical protein J437_LFUL005278 [Ladona fulva]
MSLLAAEKNPNVKLHFEHKMVYGDLSKGEITLENQTYIEHGYMELCIPPTSSGDFAMEANYLHIWPRGSFMMIALPNQDHSWTVTLFMPFAQFESLSTPDALIGFFSKYYPDAIPLLGKEKLINDFFSSKPSPLVSVKYRQNTACKPYHVGSSALIIGDAAHAMVPFYGQGMNAGFEDCTILDNLMMKHKNDLKKVLEEFSEYRNPDAESICNLAMYNYIEVFVLV